VRNARRLDVALIVVTGVGWGMLAPATKALFAADPAIFDGFSVAAVRGVYALPIFAVMLVWAWRREPPRLDPARWAAMAAAGLCFGLGITILFAVAAMYTSIAHLSFLIGSSPVTNSIAAALAFRLPFDRSQRLALGLGVVGVTLLAATRTGGTAGLFGDGLMVLWLIAFALYAVLLRYGGAGISSVLAMGIVGVIAMSAVVLVSAVIPGALRAVPHVADTPAVAGWVFGEVVLGSTIIAQLAYAGAVRRFGVAFATIGAEYTALAVGIAYSLWVREPWSWLTVLAGLLLMAALAVTFWHGRKGSALRSANGGA
jgi:drug/metabolite transporter (DMT)-like permease